MKEVNKPLVSFVILNWNGELHIHDCVASVVSQNYPNKEVIIVDNGSQDGSLEKLKKTYPAFTFIENIENLGYARGMNQGISSANGEFVVPLNQDVCLEAEFTLHCVDRMSGYDDIGAIGGRVYAWINGEKTYHSRAGEGEKTYIKKRFQGGSQPIDKEEFVFRPNGSFPFLRRDMLEDVFSVSGHYYDESFVTGWEDTDLFFRMQLRGWRCLFLPIAYGWHVGSGSVGGNATLLSKSHDYQIRILRNRYFVMIKNLPLRSIFSLFPFLLLTELSLYPYFLFKSPKVVNALCKAQLQTLAHTGRLIRLRRLIQKGKKVPAQYLNQFFISF